MSLKKNDLVFAKWGDGNYYPGHIKEISQNCSSEICCTINFLDGDSSTVRAEFIVSNDAPSIEEIEERSKKVCSYLKYVPVLLLDKTSPKSKRVACCAPYFRESDSSVCVYVIDEDEDNTLTPNRPFHVPIASVRLRQFPTFPPTYCDKRKKHSLISLKKCYENLTVGSRVFCYWPNNSRYYEAKIDQYDETKYPNCYHVKFCDGDQTWTVKENLIPDEMFDLNSLPHKERGKNMDLEEEVEGEEVEQFQLPIIAFFNGFYYRGNLNYDGKKHVVCFIGDSTETFVVPLYLIRIDVSEYLRQIDKKKKKLTCKTERFYFSKEYSPKDPVFVYWKPNQCFFEASVISSAKDGVSVLYDDNTKQTLKTEDIVKNLIFHNCEVKREDVVVGRKYLVHWKSGQWWDAIIIKKVKQSYEILYSDNTRGIVEIKNIRYFPEDEKVGYDVKRKKEKVNIDQILEKEVESFEMEANPDNCSVYPCKVRVFKKDPSKALEKICEEKGIKYEEKERVKMCSDYDRCNDSTKKQCCMLEKSFVEWRRVSETSKKFEFFRHMDFEQSKMLGNCWLLAFFPHMSEEYIMSTIFSNSKFGFFTVRIHLKDGSFGYILIDDYFPFLKNSDNLAYLRTNNSFFAVILEKCYAKIYKGYQNLCGGRKGVIWNRSVAVSGMFFGCFEFHESIQWKYGKPNKDLKERIIKMRGDKQKDGDLFYVTNLFKGKNEMGIVSGHAYAMVDIIMEDGVFLVGIRNPQGGSNAWNGPWSLSDDTMWNIYKKLGWVKEKIKHGYFVMEFGDFVNYFSEINVYVGKRTD